MSKINYKKSLAIFVSFLIFTPVFILLAQIPPGTTIKNPLGEDNTDLDSILVKIMEIVAMLGGIAVVFFIILSGFKFVMARGNPSELQKAKEMFYATIIGGAILLGAGVIATIVVGTINEIK